MRFMKNRILLLWAGVWAMFSCTVERTDRWGEERWDGIPATELTGERVGWDKPVFQEGEFLFAEDRMILENDDAEQLFRVYRISRDSLLYAGSFLYQGRGPFELNTAEHFYDPLSRTLTLVGYNFMGKSIGIPLRPIENVFDYTTWNVCDYSELPPLMAYRIFPVSDSIYITQPFDGRNSLFALYNIRTGNLKHLDMPYPDNNESVPLSQRAEAYIGHIRKHPLENRFVYSNSNSKLVILFDLDDDTVSRISMPFRQIPEYVASGRDKVRFTANHDNGYQVVVTGSRIYCADPRIDRMKREESIERNGFDAGYVREIYAMDWEGNPVARYRLDRPVCYVQPSPDDRYLYAFCTDKESLDSHIVRFSLPE